MKTLETEFTKSQWHFKQVSRIGDIAIFKRWKDGPVHYEVVRIRRHNGFKLPTGEMTEPAEYYPGDNAWGKDGYTFNELDAAITRQEWMHYYDTQAEIRKWEKACELEEVTK